MGFGGGEVSDDVMNWRSSVVTPTFGSRPRESQFGRSSDEEFSRAALQPRSALETSTGTFRSSAAGRRLGDVNPSRRLDEDVDFSTAREGPRRQAGGGSPSEVVRSAGGSGFSSRFSANYGNASGRDNGDDAGTWRTALSSRPSGTAWGDPRPEGARTKYGLRSLLTGISTGAATTPSPPKSADTSSVEAVSAEANDKDVQQQAKLEPQRECPKTASDSKVPGLDQVVQKAVPTPPSAEALRVEVPDGSIDTSSVVSKVKSGASVDAVPPPISVEDKPSQLPVLPSSVCSTRKSSLREGSSGDVLPVRPEPKVDTSSPACGASDSPPDIITVSGVKNTTAAGDGIREPPKATANTTASLASGTTTAPAKTFTPWRPSHVRLAQRGGLSSTTSGGMRNALDQLVQQKMVAQEKTAQTATQGLSSQTTETEAVKAAYRRNLQEKEHKRKEEEEKKRLEKLEVERLERLALERLMLGDSKKTKELQDILEKGFRDEVSPQALMNDFTSVLAQDDVGSLVPSIVIAKSLIRETLERLAPLCHCKNATDLQRMGIVSNLVRIVKPTLTYLFTHSGIIRHKLRFLIEVQRFLNAMKFPRVSEGLSLIEVLWDSLYMQDVIEEQYFNWWYEDTQDETPGRSNVLFQMLGWFNWLQNASAEGEADENAAQGYYNDDSDDDEDDDDDDL